MQEKIEQIMRYCKALGADYADIRVKDILIDTIDTENGKVQDITTNRSRGAGIRVYINGSMGFAASNNLDDFDHLRETAEKAFKIAQASQSLQAEKIILSPKEAKKDNYITPITIDPFTIPLQDKLSVLLECDKIMMSVGISKTMSSMGFRKEEVIFADTEGSYITQTFYQSSASISARAVSDTDMQVRTYGNVLRAGYEAVLDLKLIENAERVAQESAALLNAPECPTGVFDLILTPTQLMLQIHESIGHPTELDRILGSEAAFAGASFLTADDSIGLQYGSKHVTITADAGSPMGLGTFGYDDEGIPGQRVMLIDKGIFQNYQTSRDNASKINQFSNGMGLSDGWRNIPIVRMTNINLMPGTFELEELITGIEDGFLLDANKSWSIDDKRINFQFACEIALEIKNGRFTGKIYKNPIYAGKTTEFWNSCDGVCHEKHWRMIGVPNCGKGQPLQIMRVAHGCAPARFRQVKVGVGDVE